MTISTLVDFVIEYRRKKAFEGWSPIQIADAFIAAVEDRTLVYSTDDNGKVNGVAHAHKLKGPRVIYVCNVLTTENGVLTKLLTWLHMMYPTYTIEATRHGKRHVYNTMKLYRKFNLA